MGLHLHPSQVIFPAEQRERLSMKEKLREYIKTYMIKDTRYPLKDDEPLITGGLVDSFSLVELAVFIEDSFGVHFDDPELTADNMDTLNQIVGNIEAKQ
jgi:acyl carrier protein